MLESQLPFPQVCNPELIDERIADCPGVAWVPLLKTLLYDRAKARNVRSRSLEVVERRMRGSVGEIIVDAQILSIIDLVIHAERELVLIVSLGRNTLICTARYVCWRWQILQQVPGHRVHARRGNEGAREHRIPGDIHCTGTIRVWY